MTESVNLYKLGGLILLGVGGNQELFFFGGGVILFFLMAELLTDTFILMTIIAISIYDPKL